MTVAADIQSVPPRAKIFSESKNLRQRRAAETRFKLYGLLAISIGLGFLGLLFHSIFSKGATAFFQTFVKLDVTLSQDVIDPTGGRVAQDIWNADYTKLAREALYKALNVNVEDRKERNEANNLLSRGVDIQIRDMVGADPSIIGSTRPVWVIAHGNVDALVKGSIDRETPEDRRQVSNRQIAWIETLQQSGQMETSFNSGFFTLPNSSQPETAGMGVAIIGSVFMMLIVVLLAVPLGVAAAVYLQEFAPKNRITDLIEVNINNLAAVPSIVFGLLGLAVFINFFGLPRSASLVGGLVLTLMTLPTVIIATRASLIAVPPSIRQAALGVGASKVQTIFHHVLPLAMPGIITGTIIGLVHAVGETAPLLMIGLVAFVIEYPVTPLDSATAIPVQIYMWATEAERGFVERTAGGTIVLLILISFMSLTAIYLRRKFERKW
jgi:phosphate transport system permease protein